MNDRSDTISLYFSQGASDKEYHCQIKPRDAGFVVEFQYGRRGSTLTVGCKTPVALPYDKARAVFDKLLKEKTAKGYSPEEGGQAFQGTEHAGRVSGALPQLLNAIDEAAAKALLLDNSWLLQIKYDGERRMVRYDSGEVTGINRKGLTVSLPNGLVEAIKRAAHTTQRKQFLVDGEIMGERYIAFDLLEINGKCWRAKPLCERLLVLDALLADALLDELTPLVFAKPIYGNPAKTDWFERCKQANEEGVAFKHRDAPYTVGRPASGGPALKFKFTESATVRVSGINEGKCSVSMELLDADGTWQGVGNVTIPANHAIPGVGSIAEVAYLYAYRGGSLFQPVYKGQRADQGETDCTADQLKYKPEPQAPNAVGAV